MGFPLAGNPTVFDGRQPTLIPNFDSPVVVQNTGGAGSPVLQAESPAGFVSQTGQTRVNATSGNITVGGTITDTDTVTLTLTSGLLPGGSLALLVTIVAADDTESVAEKIADAVNDNATCQAFGITADADPGDAGGSKVVVNWPGAVGNFATFTAVKSVGSTETYSPASGSFSGGSGPVVPTLNFEFASGSQTMAFFAGRPYLLPYNLLKAMVAQGMPIA